MTHQEARVACALFQRLVVQQPSHPLLVIPPELDPPDSTLDPLWDAVCAAGIQTDYWDRIWPAYRFWSDASPSMHTRSQPVLHIVQTARAKKSYLPRKGLLMSVISHGVDTLFTELERTGKATEEHTWVLNCGVSRENNLRVVVWANLRSALALVCRWPNRPDLFPNHADFCTFFPLDEPTLTRETRKQAKERCEHDQVFCLNATLFWLHIQAHATTHDGLKICFEAYTR